MRFHAWIGCPLGGEDGVKVKVMVKSGRARKMDDLVDPEVVWVLSLLPGDVGDVTEVSVPPWLWVVLEEGEAMLFIQCRSRQIRKTCHRPAPAGCQPEFQSMSFSIPSVE